MKYCEYSGCNKKAEGILSLGGIKNYYCLKHLKLVKRRLMGI
jgi:rhodanese-related sulfurtransferase